MHPFYPIEDSELPYHDYLSTTMTHIVLEDLDSCGCMIFGRAMYCSSQKVVRMLAFSGSRSHWCVDLLSQNIFL